MTSIPANHLQKLSLSGALSPSPFPVGRTVNDASGALSKDNTKSPIAVPRLTIGKTAARRLLPIQKLEKSLSNPPKFPNLSTTSNGDKQVQLQQTMFHLLPPMSKSDSYDIAREAMRLTRETLHGHGSVGNTLIFPSNVTAQARRNSVSSEAESVEATPPSGRSSQRLNKFVRRLHDMLLHEIDSGLVEWRRGLLVLKNTSAFAKDILPKYFNTRNFKTFRRQLNYYGFVHIRSFSNHGDSTTALWVNGELARSASTAGTDPDDVSSVLLVRRMEPCDQAKTAEMRRARKELAISTIEKDFGVSAKSLQLQQLGSLRSQPKKVETKVKPSLPVKYTPKPMDVDPMPDDGLSLPVASVNYNDKTTKEDSHGEITVLTEHQPAPLSSNRSAANLLLLLSKA